MVSRLSRTRAFSLAATLSFAGCAVQRPMSERPVLPLPSSDFPDHFLVGTYDSAETVEPTPGEACRSPLVDPRDGTRLTLSSSVPGRGLYEVPTGRYGVPAGHYVQIDCGSGRALGIVGR